MGVTAIMSQALLQGSVLHGRGNPELDLLEASLTLTLTLSTKQ